jgi:hypothetical protein
VLFLVLGVSKLCSGAENATQDAIEIAVSSSFLHDREVMFLQQAQQTFKTFYAPYSFEETKDDGKTWKRLASYELFWDTANSNFAHFAILPQVFKEKEFWYIAEYSYKNKRISTSSLGDGDGKTWSNKKRKNLSVTIENHTRELPFKSPFCFFRTSEGISVYDMMGNLSQKKGIFSKFTKNNIDYIQYEVGVETFLFDARTGLLLCNKIKDAHSLYHSKMTATKYMKNGDYAFPEEIVQETIDQTGKRISYTRYVFDKQNVVINNPIDINKFVYQIPVGTRVSNDVTGIAYYESGINEQLSEEFISEHLENLYQESKKNLQDAKIKKTK